MKVLGAALVLVCLLIFAFGADASPAERLNAPKVRELPTPPAPGICNCKCSLSHNDRFCAVNKKNEKQTFQNNCQLGCYNCTHETDYTRRYDGECKKK
ncbi:Hypothetical predicted protein [Cloeon dipterum]|uniref:Kazal-like domain-containing protein n=1 Tax=Cloeon dipterum TaxID=197152 RepID=A0A8S1DLS6_9INSE|nr:Hypothetical predicted protein [Cloeon dipterum]